MRLGAMGSRGEVPGYTLLYIARHPKYIAIHRYTPLCVAIHRYTSHKRRGDHRYTSACIALCAPRNFSAAESARLGRLSGAEWALVANIKTKAAYPLSIIKR